MPLLNINNFFEWNPGQTITDFQINHDTDDSDVIEGAMDDHAKAESNQIDEAHKLYTADQDQIFEEQNNNEHDENQIENQANEYDDTIDNELVHNLEILLLDPEPYENNEAEDIEINDANDAQESIENENQRSEVNGEDQRSKSDAQNQSHIENTAPTHGYNLRQSN